ncbi:hypothetical protein JCM8097_005537 [Rhodosporidiobolus ruineniae]
MTTSPSRQSWLEGSQWPLWAAAPCVRIASLRTSLHDDCPFFDVNTNKRQPRYTTHFLAFQCAVPDCPTKLEVRVDVQSIGAITAVETTHTPLPHSHPTPVKSVDPSWRSKAKEQIAAAQEEVVKAAVRQLEQFKSLHDLGEEENEDKGYLSYAAEQALVVHEVAKALSEEKARELEEKWRMERLFVYGYANGSALDSPPPTLAVPSPSKDISKATPSSSGPAARSPSDESDLSGLKRKMADLHLKEPPSKKSATQGAHSSPTPLGKSQTPSPPERAAAQLKKEKGQVLVIDDSDEEQDIKPAPQQTTPSAMQTPVPPGGAATPTPRTAVQDFQDYLCSLDPRGTFSFSGYAQALTSSGIPSAEVLRWFVEEDPAMLGEIIATMEDKLRIEPNTLEFWQFKVFKKALEKMARGKGRADD